MPPLTPHAEPELEAMLRRVAPDAVRQWRPASEAQILEIEAWAGRSLPPFYRWFLSRMGQSHGGISQPLIDYDVGRVLEYYRENEVLPDKRHLLIGINDDDVSQAHLFYDLDKPARQDCLVGTKELEDKFLDPQRETLREMIAWGAFFRWRVRALAHQCTGMAAAEDGLHVAARLKEQMRKLGFHEPVTGGDYFGIFDRADAAMACSAPMELPPHTFGFRLGGNEVAPMRRVLGELSLGTGIKISVDDWSEKPRGPA